MAWIESHQSLAHHPKTLRLAGSLKCGVPAAIGHVHLLWYWALDYAHNGEIACSMRDQVAQACQWRGKAETFWMGLLQSGFVEATDGGVVIHDWMDYAGRLVEQRARHAARTKRARDAHRERTVQGYQPDRTGPNQPDLPDPTPLPPSATAAEGGCCTKSVVTNGAEHLSSCSVVNGHAGR